MEPSPATTASRVRTLLLKAVLIRLAECAPLIAEAALIVRLDKMRS